MIQITRGKVVRPQKVVVYGPEGIGKSTFAAQFPVPLFIDTEDSTTHLDVARVQKPKDWNMLLSTLDEIATNPDIAKEFKTIVIDTIDWAETLCVKSVCDKYNKDGIESFGYGNGYVYVKEEFGNLVSRLNKLVEVGFHIVLTAHTLLRKFEQPDEQGAYDRYELKLGKRTGSLTAPIIKEWADLLLFINYKTDVVQVDGTNKYKARGGKRVMYTSHTPAWDAKNRHGLAAELPLEYESIRAAIEGENKGKNKEVKQEPKASETVGEYKQQLQEKMSADQVTDTVIMQLVAMGKNTKHMKGVPVAEYPEEFIRDIILPQWANIAAYAKNVSKLNK